MAGRNFRHGESPIRWGFNAQAQSRKVGTKDLTDPVEQKKFSDDQLFEHLKSGEKTPEGKEVMKP